MNALVKVCGNIAAIYGTRIRKYKLPIVAPPRVPTHIKILNPPIVFY